jgi:acetone carboxylase gamma subunit
MYIVQSAKTKQWVTKCDCGHEFCGYKENWKMFANIYVRDTEEAMAEVYPNADGAGHQVAGLSRVLLPELRHDARRRSADPVVPGDP